MSETKHGQSVLGVGGESGDCAVQLVSQGSVLHPTTLPLEVGRGGEVDNYVENGRGSLAGEVEGEGEGVVGGGEEGWCGWCTQGSCRDKRALLHSESE